MKRLIQVIVCACCAITVNAATIHVPVDQPTIQAGIDAAANGDTVLVADGIYLGVGNRDVIFEDKLVVLKSENGPEATVIDCENSGRAFYISAGHDSTLVIEGFTVRNGSVGSGGGAILSYGSSPSIIGCVFADNTAEFGSAIYFSGAEDKSGRGARLIDPQAPKVTNCTFVGNTAIIRGAIYIQNVGISVTIENSIFYANTSAQQEPPVCLGWNATVNLSCTDIFGNIGGDWVGSIADQAEINGNLSVNPLFCDTTIDDYSIDSISTCAPSNNSCSVLVGALAPNCRFCWDWDFDGLCYGDDNCPSVYNPNQEDADSDNVGDSCDNCYTLYNPDQEDTDVDQIGDSCDNCPYDPDNDIDGDGICGDIDNCIYIYNPDQEDTDGDGIGDACWSEYITLTLDNMTGLYDGDSVIMGASVRWNFRLTYTPGDGSAILASTNGFRVWTHSGGTYTDNFSAITYDSFPWGWFMIYLSTGGLVMSPFSIDGLGADTIGFGGVGPPAGEYIPDGTDSLCWWIQTVPSLYGDTLCIDSSWFPPGGEWLWETTQGGVYPYWDGPHCFHVGALCGNVDGSGGINVADVIYLLDYLFFDGPAPPVLEAANVDGEVGINVADLTYLVDYLFFGGSEPICGPIE